ncbi:MAG: ferritin-like domain-containing protein [Myxococcota bacterium]
MDIRELSRRELLVRAAATAASANLAVVLSSVPARANGGTTPDPKKDNELLNLVLSAEYDLVSSYTTGASIIAADATTPKTTRDAVAKLAAHFQAHHVEHAAALKAFIQANAGTPVADPGAPSLPASFPTATAKSGEFMKLAADKEKHAALAYVDAMKMLSAQTSAKLAAAIGGVETQHFVLWHLLVEGLIATNEATAINAASLVPAAFVLNVGGAGTTHLESSPALDALLALDPP